MINLKNLKQIIRDIIKDEISYIKQLDVFVVTAVNKDNTLNIKALNLNLIIENVQMISLSNGNYKGFNVMPEINDIVLAGYLKDSETPVVLGVLKDWFSTEKDNTFELFPGEALLMSKTNGSFIFFDKNNNIIIKTKDGAKLKLKNDGEIKLYNHNNYGIKIDKNGNYTLYYNTKNEVNSSDTEF